MVAMRTVGLFLVFAICGFGCPDALGAGDPEILGWIADEYVSPEDFLDRLWGLEVLLTDRGDPRAVFASMYRVLTEWGLQSIDEGYYEDGDWVTRMIVSFANLYREAFLNYECGRRARVPQAWRVAFDACKANDIPVFYHGLLGVHAHINHDLAFAFAEVTPQAERDLRYPDFLRTHEVVLASIDVVEGAAVAYSERLGRLDAAAGQLDEKAFAELLTLWRFRAWDMAAAFEGVQSLREKGLAAALLDWATGIRARGMRRNGQFILELLPRQFPLHR
jgi:hypothetical protein